MAMPDSSLWHAACFSQKQSTVIRASGRRKGHGKKLGESLMNMLRKIALRALPIAAIALAGLSPAAAGEGDDHAEISNVMGRYAFALDGKDADSYAALFAPDGVLDYARGELHGREAIRKMVADLRARAEQQQAQANSTLRPARGRHFLTNLVIEVNGDTAKVKDYWVAFNNNNPERSAALSGFGHGENELARIGGQWLIKRRVIYNEQVPERAAADDNPSFLAPKRN